MNTKRKKIRAVIIAAVLLAAVIATVVTLQIDPSDYRKELGKSIETAQQLLDQAVVGNENGQYSEDNLLWLKTAKEEAQKSVDASDTEISVFREQAKKLKNEISNFEKLKNENCISASEMAAFQQEKKIYTKEYKLKNNITLNWSMECENISAPSSVNPNISEEGFYKEQILSILNDNQTSGIVLTFLHNGSLPGRTDIELILPEESRALYLYEYHADHNTLTYIMPAKISGTTATFSISSGGTWVLCEKEGTEVSDSGDTESQSAESETGSVSEPESSHSAGSASSIPPNHTSSASETNPAQDAASAGNQFTMTENDETSKPDVQKYSCTIEIRCDTLLNKMEELKAEKRPYVPKDGIILKEITVEFSKGETAFEILKRVTRSHGIQMEFRKDLTYSGGAYIEGIHHLYEFDCGGGSGWMYQVNGWFPNYGCANYKMQNGDKMVWCYTCNVGKDVGDQYYDTHPDANPAYQ